MPQIRVTIVEDAPIMRTTLKTIIENDPQLICVSDHDNVKDAEKQIPIVNPDIVLLDINLFGENGIEVIKTVKKIKPNIQFLMCTIFEDDDKIFDSLKAGANGYLLKKSSGEEIRDSIKTLFNGGSPMSPEIARRVVNSFKKDSDEIHNVLSTRETEILKLISNGFTYKECAEKLFISAATIRNHLHNIYEKLQVNNKTSAVNKFLRDNKTIN